jgi:hypothetical protein
MLLHSFNEVQKERAGGCDVLCAAMLPILQAGTQKRNRPLVPKLLGLVFLLGLWQLKGMLAASFPPFVSLGGGGERRSPGVASQNLYAMEKTPR